LQGKSARENRCERHSARAFGDQLFVLEERVHRVRNFFLADAHDLIDVSFDDRKGELADLFNGDSIGDGFP